VALANDSILVTPGSGATVATHAAGGKEYQAMMLAQSDGQMAGSRLMYYYNIPSQVHVASANTVHWDLFNAHSSLIVRVMMIKQLPNITTAVTGVVFNWDLARTTDVGTSGTPITAWLPDPAQTALNASITCRSKPTGGAAKSTVLLEYSIHGEETNAAMNMLAMMMAGGVADLVPRDLREYERGIVLRQDDGIRVTQLNSSAAGNTGWLIGFSVE
jgi:hypothetical protein